MLMLVLMQDYSWSAKANNHRCIISASKQAIDIKLDANVGHFLRDPDFDFANVYMVCPACYFYCDLYFRPKQVGTLQGNDKCRSYTAVWIRAMHRVNKGNMSCG